MHLRWSVQQWKTAWWLPNTQGRMIKSLHVLLSSQPKSFLIVGVYSQHYGTYPTGLTFVLVWFHNVRWDSTHIIALCHRYTSMTLPRYLKRERKQKRPPNACRIILQNLDCRCTPAPSKQSQRRKQCNFSIPSKQAVPNLKSSTTSCWTMATQTYTSQKHLSILEPHQTSKKKKKLN